MAGVARFLVFIYFISVFSHFRCELTNNIDEDVLTTQAFMFWPNATVPFYIDRNHFDEEQVTALMSALSLFAFKTCLKFAPVLGQPQDNEHVLTFENPTGLRKCEPNMEPHNINEQHNVVLGYDCLRAPEIHMVLMKELGFPFEHNRAVRDLYIDVQTENIEPGYLDMFVKDLRLPVELRSIPYDRNSVMHFGEREYSKNGHKTIIFKDRSFRQERFGLSPIDLRKIEIVYGPECKKRDRQEKIDLCQNYPGVARRKRDATTSRSLRVNPDITPPPEIDEKKQESKVRADDDLESKVKPGDAQEPNLRADDGQGYTDKVVEELGIAKEVEDLISEIHKTAGVALVKARERYCNGTKPILRVGSPEMEKPKDHSILTIIEEIASYSKNLVDKALQNLTVFCEPSKSIDDYQRASCPFFNDNRCKQRYKSTKSGNVVYSTQHRPIIPFSTKHYGSNAKNAKVNMYSFINIRSGNETEPAELDANVTSVTKHSLRSNTKVIRTGKNIYSPRFRNGKNDTDGNSRRKREVADEVAPASGAKSNGSIQTRRFQGETFRCTRQSSSSSEEEADRLQRLFGTRINTEFRISYEFNERFHMSSERARKALQGEDEEDVNWDESAVSMDNENRDTTTTTRARNVKGKATSKSDVFYHNPSPGELSGSAEASEAVDENQKAMEPKEADHGPSFAISQEEAIKPPPSVPVPKRLKPEISAPNKVKNQNRAKSKISKMRMKKNRQQMQPKIKVRKPAPSAVTERQDDNEEEAAEDVSVHYKSASKVRKLKKAAAAPPPPRKKRPSSGSSGTTSRSRGLPKTIKLTPKNKGFYDERKWPDNIVRYMIHDSGDFDLEDCRARLAEVSDILRKETCVTIEEITEAQTDLYEDYLVLDNSPDYVTGRVGGRQIFGVVELLKGGQHRQHAAMMVMAMLGFYFEVSRHDRDQYIRVHLRHIRPDKLHHFEKIREDATFNLPYDYQSAAHPAWQFWRRLGKSGISTVATYKERDPDGSVMKTLGQNEQLLSDLDIIKINSVYGIECMKPKDARADGGGRDDEDLGLGESNEPPDEIPTLKAGAGDSDAKAEAGDTDVKAGDTDVKAGNEDPLDEENEHSEEEVETK